MTATATRETEAIEVDVDEGGRREWLAGQLERAESEGRAEASQKWRAVERAQSKVKETEQAHQDAVRALQVAEVERAQASARHERTVDSYRRQLAGYAPAAIAAARVKVEKLRRDASSTRREHPRGGAVAQAVTRSAIAAMDRLDVLTHDGRPSSDIEREIVELLGQVAAGTLAPDPDDKPEPHPALKELSDQLRASMGIGQEGGGPGVEGREVRLRPLLNETYQLYRDGVRGERLAAALADIRARAGRDLKTGRRAEPMIRGRERPAAVVAQDDGDYGG